MDLHVIFEIRRLREGSVTLLAPVRPFSFVTDSDVPLEADSLTERLPALVALIRLQPLVGPFVAAEVGLTAECFPALVADVGFFPSVGPRVPVEVQ